MLFPQSGSELGHVFGGVRANPLEHVYEIIVGVDALESARTEEALDDAEMLGSELCPAEHPISPSYRYGSNLSFDPVRVYGHVGIFQEDLQWPLAAADIEESFGEGIAG